MSKKRTILLICAIMISMVFTLLAIMFYPSQVELPQAALVAEESFHDFGDVQQGILSTATSLKNTSKEEIQISHVVKSCSCEEVHVPKTKLSPGQNIEIHYSVQTHQRKGPMIGNLAVVYFPTTTPETKFAVELHYKANILKPF